MSSFVIYSCDDTERNSVPLVDPWTRERTPLSLTLDGQVGKATITNDWRHDDIGNISVTLIVPDGDGLKSVKVKELTLQYKATADIGPGSTLDFSNGSAKFIVTAENGETRTYTITYEPFKELLEGTYSVDVIQKILGGGNEWDCAVVIGGPDNNNIVMSTAMDKVWKWKDGYGSGLSAEKDNTISIKLSGVDEASGSTYGTIVNLPGDDGKYSTWIWNSGSVDLSTYYRIIPKGKSRWMKDVDGNISFFDINDQEMESPLYSCIFLDSGAYTYDGKTLTIVNQAFKRTFNGPFGDWSDTGDGRWMRNNIRHTFTLVKKISDSPLENHNELLNE